MGFAERNGFVKEKTVQQRHGISMAFLNRLVIYTVL